MAAALYVLNHLFFALALAIKTYFQKIASPGDIAPTAAVAFTINHIAAVFLPAALGYLWLSSPISVFLLAAGMAVISLILSCLVPRHPEPGRETTLTRAATRRACRIGLRHADMDRIDHPAREGACRSPGRGA
jgi:hypothetical protein